MAERTDPQTRFWAKVEKTDGCWLWQGVTNGKKGYGQFWVSGRMVYAHRWSWEQANGTTPEGMFVCHRCDVPACVRPDHLFLGTNGDNMTDMYQKGRNSPRITHCKRGHELTPTNSYWWRAARHCRECKRQYQRNRRNQEPISGSQ